MLQGLLSEVVLVLLLHPMLYGVGHQRVLTMACSSFRILFRDNGGYLSLSIRPHLSVQELLKIKNIVILAISAGTTAAHFIKNNMANSIFISKYDKLIRSRSKSHFIDFIINEEIINALFGRSSCSLLLLDCLDFLG
jgi:hypothetical protein